MDVIYLFMSIYYIPGSCRISPVLGEWVSSTKKNDTSSELEDEDDDNSSELEDEEDGTSSELEDDEDDTSSELEDMITRARSSRRPPGLISAALTRFGASPSLLLNKQRNK